MRIDHEVKAGEEFERETTSQSSGKHSRRRRRRQLGRQLGWQLRPRGGELRKLRPIIPHASEKQSAVVFDLSGGEKIKRYEEKKITKVVVSELHHRKSNSINVDCGNVGTILITSYWLFPSL